MPYKDRFLFDLHCDTLTACLAPERQGDTLDAPDAQLSLSGLPPQVHWAQCFAIFVPDGLSPAQAVRYYESHRDSFHRQMALSPDRVSPCTSAGDVTGAWAQNKTAAILTVENGAALGGDLSRLDTLARDGVRMMTLTWNRENQLGSGSQTDHGLSPLGRAAVSRMEELGILADVSHLNDRGFADLLDVARKPFAASHSNARAVCGHRRNLTDAQLREMIARRCLIGLNYYAPFLRADGAPAGLEDVYRHAAHILDLGGEDCLALGSDFDGAELPPSLDSPAKAAGLYDYFLARGLSPALCDGILYRNALDFFQSNL